MDTYMVDMCARIVLGALFIGVHLSVTPVAGEGPRCFQCMQMPIPSDCKTVASCSDNEVCFVDAFIDRTGLTTYNLGCRAQWMCLQKRDIPYRRSSVRTCSHCCQDEFCNHEGCNTIVPDRSTRGPFCFDCKAQGGEHDCRTITECDTHEVCSIERNIEYGFYRSRCIQKLQCNTVVQQFHPASSSANGHSLYMDHCPLCCGDDFCNDNCNHNVSTATLPLRTTVGRGSVDPALNN